VDTLQGEGLDRRGIFWLRYVTASLVLGSRELIITAFWPRSSSNNERSGKQDGYS
jgi:hypothetical protein